MVGRLEVVPHAHRDAMADPIADDVLWELQRPLRFATSPQRLPKVRPGSQPRPLENRLQPAVQVVARKSDNPLASLGSRVKRILERLIQRGDDWHRAMLASLGGEHRQSLRCQSTSPHVRRCVSLGVRRPARRASPNSTRHRTSGQLSRIATASAGVTYRVRTAAMDDDLRPVNGLRVSSSRRSASRKSTCNCEFQVAQSLRPDRLPAASHASQPRRRV